VGNTMIKTVNQSLKLIQFQLKKRAPDKKYDGRDGLIKTVPVAD
jgi:hypothetical protein